MAFLGVLIEYLTDVLGVQYHLDVYMRIARR